MHPSMRRVQAVAAGDGAMWAGTDGGVFRYDLASGEITRYTTAEGLAGSDVQTVAFDDGRSVVWLGFADGVLQRLSTATGQMRTYFDIARADRYPQRGVNRIRPMGDSLMVATEFGVVVFDVERGEVRDTYDRFGTLDAGQPAYDIIAAPRPDGTAGFWVATRGGVVHADRYGANLRAPSAWTVDAQAPAPALALGHFEGRMYAGRQSTPGEGVEVGDLWRRQPDGAWTRQFASGQDVTDIIVRADRMKAVSSFFVTTFRADGTRATVLVQENGVLLSGDIGPDGRLWVGSRIFGLMKLPDLATAGQANVAEEVIIPAGPLSNEILALDVGPGGTVWVGYRPAFGVINGMGRFDGTGWRNFSAPDGYDVALAPIRSVLVDRRGYAWGGSEGDGLMRVSPDGEVVTFRPGNSTLEPEPGHSVVMVFGVAEDSRGNIWVTNRQAAHALHRWNPEDGWTAVPRPPGTPAAASFMNLYIDSFDQKWATLFRTGYLVARSSPTDPTDTEAVVVAGIGSPATGTGLPHPTVQAYAEDLDGRVWIGTERGLATVFSPGSVMANPALAQPTWARTPDQASYFLRDLNILAIDVDPAGRKWLASSSGVWLINAAGNEVEAHFTPENSPLPSSMVVDVAVDGASGRVWFATDAGLVSYRGVAIDPAVRAERLRVYPNPFRPEDGDQVRFEGLVAETRIRILTVDGQVVAAFDARGGAATWDGRDQRTGQIVPSGVYVVAAAGTNGEGTAYGKIAVIR